MSESVPTWLADKLESLHAIDERTERTEKMVREMSVIIQGNGKPHMGLAFRVARLEEIDRESESKSRKWGHRAWQAFVAVVLVFFGWWIKK